MATKECFGCEKVTSHEHLHDCAPGSPETHMVGSERFVCVLCKHVTFAGSDGASRFPFTFDKVAAGPWVPPRSGDPRGRRPNPAGPHHPYARESLLGRANPSLKPCRPPRAAGSET